MTEEAPVTLDTLVADLRKLGLAEGDAVVMRCATRAIAPSAKGMAGLLLDALLETVGPTGTVVGPTHAALQKASEKRPVAVFSGRRPHHRRRFRRGHAPAPRPCTKRPSAQFGRRHRRAGAFPARRA